MYGFFVSRPASMRKPRQLAPAAATMLALLTDKHGNEVVVLRDEHKLSFAKIGERLGMSGEAARQKYYAAINKEVG